MSLISVDFEGPVALITLQNPPQNRINETLAAELSAAIDKIEVGEVRAVVRQAAPGSGL
jgi:enoyl-CoA hydratase/carnithine racemase